jgi:hypothetical protein
MIEEYAKDEPSKKQLAATFQVSCAAFFIILSGVRLSLLILQPLLAYCTSRRY